MEIIAVLVPYLLYAERAALHSVAPLQLWSNFGPTQISSMLLDVEFLTPSMLSKDIPSLNATSITPWISELEGYVARFMLVLTLEPQVDHEW